MNLVITNAIGQSDYSEVLVKYWTQKESINSRLKLVSFLDTGVTSDRADIDHAIAELNKSTTLLGQLHFRDVAQTEVCQFLVSLLP